MTKKPYTGILAEETFWPFGRNPIGVEKDVILNQMHAKLIALVDRYDIPGGLGDPGTGWLLAAYLAGEHVRGFAPTYRPSPKPKYRPPDLHVGARDLILCLELLRAEMEGRSVRQASRELAEQWRKAGTCNWKAESLFRHYMLLCKGEPTEGMKEAARVLIGGT